MDLDLKSLVAESRLTSRLALQLVAIAALIGLVIVTIPLLDRDPSDSVEIETRNADRPDDEPAPEEVGAEQLASAGTLDVDGLDPLDGNGAPAIEATADESVSLAPSSTEPDSSSSSTGTASEVTVSTPAGQAGSSTSSGGSSATTPSSEPPGSQGSASQPTSGGTTSAGSGSSAPGGGGSTTTTGSSGSETTQGSQTTATAPPATNPPTGGGQVAPANIPFARNGVGDGATGGRSPYTPPAARVDVQDVADRSATTVQADCSGNADCGAAIKSIMNTNRARPLKITFGDPARRGVAINFRSPVRLQSDVYLEGINQPKLVVTAGSILFNVSNTTNVSIRNFDLDMQGCRGNSNAVVAAAGPVSNLFVSGINVTNAAPSGNGYCENDFLRLAFDNGSASNINLYGNTVSRLRRFVRVQSDLDTIRVYNNRITEIGFEGYVQTWQSISRNVTIEGNVFSRHAPRTVGGHMIGFPISKARSPQTYARNVVIRNNLVEGRPNLPHVKIDGVPQPTGGAGDLIAIRGIDGFLLESNMVRHSGEVGITATAGLKNGTIRYNQVSYTDTTGIVLGNEAANSNERVTNVDVYRNEMFQNSLDRNREYTDRDHPTFSLWNTTDSCIVNNYIHHNMNSNGFWVWNGNNPTWPASVFDVYINGQSFHDNIRDFVESSNQRGPYSPASPRGGENWTSSFDRAVDRDGDGLPSLCHSERNDDDPCVPDVHAEACRN